MSMFSEVVHSMCAKDLEKILLEAQTNNLYQDCRECVKGFVRQFVYPLYLSYCEEAWKIPNPEITKIYGTPTKSE